MSQQRSDDYYLPDGRPRFAMTDEERAVEQRLAHRAAYEQAEAQTEAWRAREGKIEERARGLLSGGMPSAKELGIDVTGLGQARARLLIGKAWIAKVRGEVPGLIERRDAFLRALGAAAETRSELQQVQSAVGLVIRQYYDAGSQGPAPDIRKGERDVLVEKLALEDALAAEVSNGLLEESEIEIAACERAVAELEGRSEGWLTAATIEVGAAPIGERVRALVSELVQELALVTGLASLADPGSDLANVRGGARVSLGIAMPWGDSTAEVPGGAAVSRIADEWRDIRSAIERDARAKVVAPRAREILPPPSEVFEPEPVVVAPVAAPSILRRAAAAVLRQEKPGPLQGAKQVPAQTDGPFQFTNYPTVL
jgi:hypothetical protein